MKTAHFPLSYFGPQSHRAVAVPDTPTASSAWPLGALCDCRLPLLFPPPSAGLLTSRVESTREHMEWRELTGPAMDFLHCASFTVSCGTVRTSLSLPFAPWEENSWAQANSQLRSRPQTCPGSVPRARTCSFCFVSHYFNTILITGWVGG